MTTPFTCLLVITFLPYPWAFLGGFLAFLQQGELDNKYHRKQQASLTGAAARAYGAHYNAFEALPVFTAAVVTNHHFSKDPALSAKLAVAFVVFRILHGVTYVADWDKTRSVAFGGAILAAVALFFV